MAQGDAVEFAHSGGLAATKRLTRDEQKLLGQFMTPPAVAKFMARNAIPRTFGPIVRILDPGAGSGVLAAAVVAELLSRPAPPEQIAVTLFESDERLVPMLRRLAARLRHLARIRGVALSVAVRHEDFLLSREALSRKSVADVIIANPPYFKISARDPRAVAHAFAVYGQPNIYGLFMAVCADLLAPGGCWCFITPRSWTNGLYFRAVRRHIFRALSINAMHLFESRRNHFTDDKILQEAMITWGTAHAAHSNHILVSSSAGTRDLDTVKLHRLPASQVIDTGETHAVSLPTADSANPLSEWNATLATYGLRVSTGPVVAFRASRYLREASSDQTVPLLWMQHIKHMCVEWPIGKKRECILANANTAWMLVPNINLVVMRRFSPKEDRRRVTAAPYLSGQLHGPVIGLENHTNYIFRPGGSLTTEEAKGVAALLNSAVVDRYLRNIAGSTQVNATDLRRLPLPSMETIQAIGRRIPSRPSLQEVDAIVQAELFGSVDVAEVA
ncbi:MAG: Eco57I restriction-modification methylase domain-containing protein [Burkholderiales bacterium]|nr:Eco57I restriction-modification methylase domain-containing protein [Burkholderiales bacterium]